MPTYEYICGKCGEGFEQFQSMSAEPLKVCPKNLCPKKKWGKGKVRRAIGGGAGLIFKGSGFYITDYRSSGYKTSAKKDSAGSSPATPSAPSAPSTPSAPASSGKSESKPAAAPSKPAAS